MSKRCFKSKIYMGKKRKRNNTRTNKQHEKVYTAIVNNSININTTNASPLRSLNTEVPRQMLRIPLRKAGKHFSFKVIVICFQRIDAKTSQL